MAKEKGEKTNLYLLSIVAIVAIVGIVVLVLNSGAGSVSLSSDDLSGQAIRTMGSSSSMGSTSDSISATTLSNKCMTCHDNGKCGPPIYDC